MQKKLRLSPRALHWDLLSFLLDTRSLQVVFATPLLFLWTVLYLCRWSESASLFSPGRQESAPHSCVLRWEAAS